MNILKIFITLFLPLIGAGESTSTLNWGTSHNSPQIEPVTKVDVSRISWGKNSPALEERMKPHTDCPVKKLTVHYTGMKKNLKLDIKNKLKNLYDFSINDKKWGDVPYNFYIDANGTLAEGRSTRFRPDTNTNYNTNCHITTVVEGNDKKNPADEPLAFTKKQRDKLYAKLKELQKAFNVPTKEIGVHNDYTQTDCPGKEVKDFVYSYKKQNPLGM